MAIRSKTLEWEIESDRQLLKRLAEQPQPDDLTTRLQHLERLLLDWWGGRIGDAQVKEEFAKYCTRNAVEPDVPDGQGVEESTEEHADREQTPEPERDEREKGRSTSGWLRALRAERVMRALGLCNQQEAYTKTITKHLTIPPSTTAAAAPPPAFDQESINVQIRLSQKEYERQQLQKRMGLEVPHPALLALYGRCFSTLLGTTSYQICPFQNITQHQQTGNMYILGTWRGWKDNNLHSLEMEYAEGTACWQGPKRETRVKLFCGAANEVLSVAEPSTCSYIIKVKTPAVCSPED